MSSLGYLKYCLYLIEKDRKVGEEDVQQRVWTQTQPWGIRSPAQAELNWCLA